MKALELTLENPLSPVFVYNADFFLSSVLASFISLRDTAEEKFRTLFLEPILRYLPYPVNN